NNAQTIHIKNEDAVLAPLRAGHVIVERTYRLNAHILERHINDVPGITAILVFFQGIDLLGLLDVRNGIDGGMIDMEMRHKDEIGLDLWPAIGVDGMRIGDDASALGRDDLEERLPMPADDNFVVIGRDHTCTDR